MLKKALKSKSPPAKVKRAIKVGIRRGHRLIVGVVTPPDKEFGRWNGRTEDGAIGSGDTAEECADDLQGHYR
jgi:hypothetical protein